MQTFRCGHPRSPGNIVSSGSLQPEVCKTCRVFWRDLRAQGGPEAVAHEKARRQAEKERARPPKRKPGRKRQTHCAKGHEYTPENTYEPPTGRSRRLCRACMRIESAATKERYRDEYLAKRRDYHAANSVQIRVAQKAWRLANPELAQAAWQRRRDRLRNGSLTGAEWRAVLDHYGTDCLACGQDKPPTIDHVVPISRGGPNIQANVQPLCLSCNQSKGTKIIDYRPDKGRWFTAEGE